MHPLVCRLAVAALLPLALAGCGPSTPTGAKVRGTVSYNGKPLPVGSVTFIPADPAGRAVAGEVTDGKFEVNGVTPGKNRVHVDAFKAKTQGTAERLFTGDVPGNDMEVEVGPGEQEQTIKLGQSQ